MKRWIKQQISISITIFQFLIWLILFFATDQLINNYTEIYVTSHSFKQSFIYAFLIGFLLTALFTFTRKPK